MLPSAKVEEIEYVTNNPENPVETASYSNEIGDFPFARALDVFKIFPDVYNGTMRHVTERDVTSLDGFLTTFKSLIDSPENLSPFKDLVPQLNSVKNQNWADFRDFGIIRDQIHQQMNYNFSRENAFIDVFSQTTGAVGGLNTSADSDSQVTDGLIEYKYYVDELNIVIHANNYPVYIGVNPYGFIPFVLSSTTNEKKPLGVEGVPYILAGMEKTMNSYMNNYLDSVKSVANPTFVARKGLFTDEEVLEELPPG